MGMDHRWGRRQPTDVAVQFVTKPGTTGTGRVLNISLTGAYLETQVPLRLHSLVYLEPAVPAPAADHRRRVAASVVRRDALGVGLEWCEPTTEKANVSARLAHYGLNCRDDSRLGRGMRSEPSQTSAAPSTCDISWNNPV
jgi:hypothetical protein